MSTRSPAKTRARFSGRKAFTLVELIVALGAGTIAVAAAYALSGTSSRTFASQLKLSDTQMALRMGMDQVRRDFARAAYLAAVDSAGSAKCNASEPRSDIVFKALAVTIDGSKTADGTGSAVTDMVGTANALTLGGVRLDSVRLVGNFATSEDYELSEASSTNDLALDTTKQAFRRSFGTTQADWSSPFESVFKDYRMVRVEDSGGNLYFHSISGANGDATPSVSISSSSCVADLRTATAAPVMDVEYIVVPIDGANTPSSLVALDGTPDTIGAKRMALIRRERSMDDGAVVSGSERVVLDYVTEFRVDGVIDTSGSGAFEAVNATTGTTVQDAPVSQFRSLVVTLAARTQEVDRVRPHKGRMGDMMVTYLVDGDDVSSRDYGVASVRTLKTEVMLANFLNQR